MLEEKISQEFRLKNIDKTRNYLIEEINRNELISDKHKTVFTPLSYNEHSLILIRQLLDEITFASLVGIPTGITSSAVGLKVCVINAAIKIFKSIIKKKEKEA